MAHLRFSVDHAVGPCLYTRGDGTLSYFFTVDRVMALAMAAGLVCASCEYHTVFNTNRKSGVQVRAACSH
jgi:methyltransferase-like protein 6